MKKAKIEMLGAMLANGGVKLQAMAENDLAAMSGLTPKDRKWLHWNSALITAISRLVELDLRSLAERAGPHGEVTIKATQLAEILNAAQCLEVLCKRLHPFATAERISMLQELCDGGEKAVAAIRDSFPEHYESFED